jgi:phenylpropionate dioxygenase-like ring-hydroxylating dioxygenase large terminal subunit
VTLPAPDCKAVPVKLLGENLLAYCNTSGRAWIVDEVCPFRLASLSFGRSDGNGLRCVHDGWKFDVDGHCIEEMNETVPYLDMVELTSYPVAAWAVSFGSIWGHRRNSAVDNAIITIRRLLFDDSKTIQDGRDPPGPALRYSAVRAIERIVSEQASWRDVIVRLMLPARD